MTGDPLNAAAIEEALSLDGDYKQKLERLLLTLSAGDADAAMMLLKEGRAAWALLCEGSGGRALVLGNSLTGTVTPLVELGYQVVLADDDPLRLRWAKERDEAYSPGQVEHLEWSGGRLPFEDGAFDLVVRESGPLDLVEFERVCKGEKALVLENRLAYKRSTGRRGKFDKPGPLAWLKRAFDRSSPERTLTGYRRVLPDSRAYSLYPDALEFSHVVALGGGRPRLTIGPMERKNRLKVLAEKLGLFPWLTPSYAFLNGGRSRLDRMLDSLGERLGRRVGEADVLIATRSNTALVLTTGDVAIHVPLGPYKRRQARIHAQTLGELATRFPTVPAPHLLFEGELEGVYLVAEERVAGMNAPQLTGDRAATTRLFEEACDALAALKLGDPVPMEEAEFDELLGSRFELVQSLVGHAPTAAEVERRSDALREALVGHAFPRVLYHADLRAKHLHVDASGQLLAFLDWGTCEPSFLPYVDLLHLMQHQRKQERGCLPGVVWREWLAGDRRPHEEAARERYAHALGLEDGFLRAVEEAYPLILGGMAERNWDYSRPQFLHRQYGI